MALAVGALIVCVGSGRGVLLAVLTAVARRVATVDFVAAAVADRTRVAVEVDARAVLVGLTMIVDVAVLVGLACRGDAVGGALPIKVGTSGP